MPYSRLEFAQQIKTKYPEYNDWDDDYLVDQITTKYPEYNDWIAEPVPEPRVPTPTVEQPPVQPIQEQPVAPTTPAPTPPSRGGGMFGDIGGGDAMRSVSQQPTEAPVSAPEPVVPEKAKTLPLDQVKTKDELAAIISDTTRSDEDRNMALGWMKKENEGKGLGAEKPIIDGTTGADERLATAWTPPDRGGFELYDVEKEKETLATIPAGDIVAKAKEIARFKDDKSRSELIATLPAEEQERVKVKVEEVSKASPILGTVAKYTKTLVDALKNDAYDESHIKKLKENINNAYDGKPPEELITSIDREAKTGRKIAKKLGGVSTAIEKQEKVLNPKFLQDHNLKQRIQELKESDFELGNSLEMGLLPFAISKMVGDAVATDDEERARELIALKKQFNSVAGTKREGEVLPGWVNRVVEMAGPMVTSGAAGAVLPILGVSQWARQGMGDTYEELVESGVSHETARSIAPLTGLLYAAVEKMQIGQITNIGQKAAKKGITSAIKNRLLKLVADKGLDWVQQVGEEGLQRLITDIGVEVGKQAEGLSDKKFGEILLDEVKNVGQEMAGASVPMGVLSILGFGAGAISGRGSQASVEGDLSQPAPDGTLTTTLGEDGQDQQALVEKSNNIVNVTARLDDLVSETKDEKKRQRIINKFRDKVLGDYDVVGFDEVSEMQKELEVDGIPYVYERSDGGNLGGLNDQFGSHEEANEILRNVWGELYAKAVIDNGGAIGRDQGDEFMAIWPNKTVDEVEKIRYTIEQGISDRVKELGFSELEHKKEQGLKTGTLYTDFGLVGVGPDQEFSFGKYGDIDREADKRSGLMKEERKEAIRERGKIDSKVGLPEGDNADTGSEGSQEAGSQEPSGPVQTDDQREGPRPTPVGVSEEVRQTQMDTAPDPELEGASMEQIDQFIDEVGQTEDEIKKEQQDTEASQKKEASADPTEFANEQRAGLNKKLSRKGQETLRSGNYGDLSKEDMAIISKTAHSLNEHGIVTLAAGDTWNEGSDELFSFIKGNVATEVGGRKKERTIKTKEQIAKEKRKKEKVKKVTPKKPVTGDLLKGTEFEETNEQKLRRQKSAEEGDKQEDKGIKGTPLFDKEEQESRSTKQEDVFAQDPKAHEETLGKDSPDYLRKRGFGNTSGAVSGQKQNKVEPSKDNNKDASKVQKVFDKQRSDVKDKLGFSLSRWWDATTAKVIEKSRPLMVRLMKQAGGKTVVMHHALSKGASAESLRQYEELEKKVYNNVKHTNENLFADYIQALRTIEVEGLKKGDIKSTGGLTAEQYGQWISEVKEQHPDAYKQIIAGQEEYAKVMQGQLDMLLKDGLIDEKFHAKLTKEHKNYSPRRFIQHIDPNVESFDKGGKVISVPDSGIETLSTGSEESMMNNPRMLMAQVISRTQGRIFKNRANKAMYDWAKKTPDNDLGVTIQENADDKTPTGQTKVSVMIDGKRESMLMPNSIAQYWIQNDSKVNKDLMRAINVLSGSAILKPMATGINPGFALANLPRDIMHSWFVTKEYSPVLPIAWAQQAKDFSEVAKDVIHRTGVVKEYIQEGGGMDFLTNQGAIFGGKPWEPVGSTNEMLKQTQGWLAWLGETSELWTRMALRNRAIKNGASKEEATWVARSYMDFAQGGSWSKAADSAIPYLNAGIQGTRGAFRAFQEDPGLAITKVAQIVAFGATLAFWNRRLNEEAWEQISDREKATKWILTTPIWYKDEDGEKRYIYLGIPKDQAQRIYATVGEMLVEKAQTGKANFNRLNMAATDLIPVGPANILPPTMQAWLGYVFNKDFWRDEDIWKGREVSPKEEYWNTTPPLWVMFGKGTGLSPEKSRRAFNKVVPQNGYTYLLEAMHDQVFGALSDKEQEKINKPLIAKMSELPLAKRLVRQTWPRTGSKAKLFEEAQRLGLEVDKDGVPISYEKITAMVETARTKVNDAKTKMDRKFDNLVTRALIGDSASEENFIKELDKLYEKDPKESKRISNRIRKKYPEVLGGKFYMRAILQNPRKIERKFEFLDWYKSTSAEEKSEFSKMYGKDLKDDIKKLQKSLVDINTKQANDRKRWKKQLIAGDINKTEYMQKIEGQKKDIQTYKDYLK